MLKSKGCTESELLLTGLQDSWLCCLLESYSRRAVPIPHGRGPTCSLHIPHPHSSHPTPQVWVSCPWWYRSEICLCPSPKGAAPVASISSSATIQTHIPGLGLSTHISVPSITSWSCRIIASVSWWLRATAKYQIYPRGVSMRAQWWWWDRGLEPHNYS